jgi:YbbR domain-containing protein
VALALASGRHLDVAARDMPTGTWGTDFGRSIADQRVLIIGYGNIGAAIERRLAGFEVASVTVNPPVVNVEGDANDLAGLERLDTVPVIVTGASSQVTQQVGLVLPPGVQAFGGGTVKVTVELRPVNATRTYEAGLIVVGERDDRRYELSTDRVLVTIAGSVAELDRLGSTSLTLTVDVTGLDPGTHKVEVSANLTTGLSLIDVSPNPIEVTVSIVEAPEPSPGASSAP